MLLSFVNYYVKRLGELLVLFYRPDPVDIRALFVLFSAPTVKRIYIISMAYLHKHDYVDIRIRGSDSFRPEKFFPVVTGKYLAKC
jgi:hypothetical protein